MAIARRLKGLESAISVSFGASADARRGLHFEDDGTHHDDLLGCAFMHEVYTRAAPNHTGRVNVPVLWDKELGTIVNNESSELIRMFDQFAAVAEHPEVHLYPEALRAEIDAVNAEVYDHVNNGVYKCGFAGTQSAYEAAFGQPVSRSRRPRGAPRGPRLSGGRSAHRGPTCGCGSP